MKYTICLLKLVELTYDHKKERFKELGQIKLELEDRKNKIEQGKILLVESPSLICGKKEQEQFLQLVVVTEEMRKFQQLMDAIMKGQQTTSN